MGIDAAVGVETKSQVHAEICALVDGIRIQQAVESERRGEVRQRDVEAEIEICLRGIECGAAVLIIEPDVEHRIEGDCHAPRRRKLKEAVQPQIELESLRDRGEWNSQLIVAAGEVLGLRFNTVERVLQNCVELLHTFELIADQRQAGGRIDGRRQRSLIRLELVDEILPSGQKRPVFQRLNLYGPTTSKAFGTGFILTRPGPPFPKR